MRRAAFLVAAVCTTLSFATLSFGASFSFTGNFNQDDDVQIFDFSVTSLSDVTLRSYSYAGGTNAAGTVIPRGGFDPILALFASNGTVVTEQDDAGCGNVPADAVTGSCYDVLLVASLVPGNYSVSVMQYDNFADGITLAGGFTRQGQGNFTATEFGPAGATTPFWDVNNDQRQSFWAFDILNVSQATQEPPVQPPPTGGEIPEPGTVILAASGVLAIVVKRGYF